jgi:hypothetical protein
MKSWLLWIPALSGTGGFSAEANVITEQRGRINDDFRAKNWVLRSL